MSRLILLYSVCEFIYLFIYLFFVCRDGELLLVKANVVETLFFGVTYHACSAKRLEFFTMIRRPTPSLMLQNY